MSEPKSGATFTPEMREKIVSVLGYNPHWANAITDRAALTELLASHDALASDLAAAQDALRTAREDVERIDFIEKSVTALEFASWMTGRQWWIKTTPDCHDSNRTTLRAALDRAIEAEAEDAALASVKGAE